MTRDIDKVLDYMRRYVNNPYEHYSEPMLNYKDLELVLKYIDKYKEVLDKIKEYIEYNACCIHDEEILNHILELLEEIE